MGPILTIDIGAGTLDILVFFPDSGEHYKAVAISPIKKTAQNILNGKGDLLITGTIMGGGAVSKAVIQRAQSYKVYMTPEAAQTINDDISKERKKGVTIISENETKTFRKDNDLTHITFGD
ncbi:MAG: pyruvate formate-lyase activating enzyme, partial [Deltaproteobacteria bacterium]|nr:pyruvate formate-lyase activating enzyme [Deltaproteobacteria bacterium]